jgi:hypothetical protein
VTAKEALCHHLIRRVARRAKTKQMLAEVRELVDRMPKKTKDDRKQSKVYRYLTHIEKLKEFQSRVDWMFNQVRLAFVIYIVELVVEELITMEKLEI